MKDNRNQGLTVIISLILEPHLRLDGSSYIGSTE